MTDDRQRYQHKWRCRKCGDPFFTVRLTADASKMNPRCPKRACGGKSKQSFMDDIGMDVSAGKAPGVVGANVQNNSYDAAMQIAMADHQMTDIQDTSRPGSVYRTGENTAPKLPPHLQAKSDAFWGGQSKQKTRTAKVDMSPIFGERAQSGAATAQFKADSGSLIEPILRHKSAGSSPIPDYTSIN